MFDRRWRSGVERGLEPVGSTIRRTGISADHLTASGLVLAGACAIAIGTGRLALALSLAFHAVMISVLWVMLGLTIVTAVQRFAMVWQQSSSRPEAERRLARWRAWRTAHGYGDVDLGRPWRRRAADAADRERRSAREAVRAAARERRGNRRATRTRP